MSNLQKVETKQRPDWFSCHFVSLTANIATLLLYTISPSLEIHHLVLKDQRNCLGWWYTSFKILALIWCRPLLFPDVYRVDTSSFLWIMWQCRHRFWIPCRSIKLAFMKHFATHCIRKQISSDSADKLGYLSYWSEPSQRAYFILAYIP